MYLIYNLYHLLAINNESHRTVKKLARILIKCYNIQ